MSTGGKGDNCYASKSRALRRPHPPWGYNNKKYINLELTRLSNWIILCICLQKVPPRNWLHWHNHWRPIEPRSFLVGIKPSRDFWKRRANGWIGRQWWSYWWYCRRDHWGFSCRKLQSRWFERKQQTTQRNAGSTSSGEKSAACFVGWSYDHGHRGSSHGQLRFPRPGRSGRWSRWRRRHERRDGGQYRRWYRRCRLRIERSHFQTKQDKSQSALKRPNENKNFKEKRPIISFKNLDFLSTCNKFWNLNIEASWFLRIICFRLFLLF